MTTRVAVVGASGTMGRLVTRLVDESDDFTVAAALNSRSELSEMLGADIAVDVTVPAASASVVAFAVEHGITVVVGTSGWSAARIAALTAAMADKTSGVLIIPNFSIGSVLATSLATIAARFYDSIEIVEAHHAGKLDSPSGTAIRTAELIGSARAGRGPVAAPHADQRARGEQIASVPIHSLRLEGLLARQEVLFGGDGETLAIRHETLAASAYERGILLALRAARTTKGVLVGLDRLIDLTTPS